MTLTLPDYGGSSIVNLMSSVAGAFGRHDPLYPPLRMLDDAPLPRDGHIVMWVIDGLGYRYLREARGAAVFQSHLKGAITSVFPSTTATAVTTFLSGRPAQQHGLTGWHHYLEEVDQCVAILPFETRAGGLSLTRLGVDPARLFDQPTFFEGLDAECFNVSPESIATSTFNRAHTRGATTVPYRSHTQMFEAIERLTRETGRRRYIYAYVPELDSSAHEFGVASAHTAGVLERLAQGLERLLRATAGRGVTLLVTADHGFVDIAAAQRLELGDHPRLQACLRQPLSGERRLVYCHVKPSMREAFETYAAEHLSHACTALPSATLIERGYFGCGPAHPKLAQRAGDYTLMMHPGFTLKDWLPDEKPHTLVGVHGGTTQDEMEVPLVLVSDG